MLVLLPKQLRRHAFAVHDATAGGHQIHIARHDALHTPDAVSMKRRTFEQKGHRREPDVRARLTPPSAVARLVCGPM